MEEWIAAAFYRGLHPTEMGYAELQYYFKHHEAIADAELKAAQGDP